MTAERFRPDFSFRNTILLNVIMRWLLAGYCGLALINISVALEVTQMPRYFGMLTGRPGLIYCLNSTDTASVSTQWYKAAEYDVAVEDRTPIVKDERISMRDVENGPMKSLLYFRALQVQDNGVYFCKINDQWGEGTAVQVGRPAAQVQYRTNMKDGLIILQGLMLAVFIAAVLMRKRTLLEKRDIIYEEPEDDHIYEGLAIETCTGDLYEELSVYAQADGAEAPWEQDN